MKNKILITILLIIIFIPLFIATKEFINKNILKDEESQILFLSQKYKEFIKNDMYNVTLDKSALQNIITGQYFKEENIQKLKSVVKSENVSDLDAILYSNYIPQTSTLVLKLKVIKNGNFSLVKTTNYKLGVRGRKIISKDGSITNMIMSKK